MEPHKIWIEQCEAVEGIGVDFGPQNAIGYLVGEKFLNFLEAAETNADFRAEIPAFVDRIPPIMAEPFAPKVTGNTNPSASAASCRAERITAASTVVVRVWGLISWIWFIRSRDIMIPPGV